MNRAALLAFALPLHGAIAPRPPPLLPTLPSVARVKVTSHGANLAVVEEVNLPRGEWRGEALHFYIAFGAPAPKAIDVRLVPVEDGSLEAADDEPGEVMPMDRVPRRPANAHALLGREAMAGIVVHVRPESFTKALARGNMATLRVRSLVETTPPDPSGASSVLVRLGAARGTPLTLGRIVATSAEGAPPLGRIEARLCGPDADPHPLAARILGAPRDPNAEPVIAPVLAVRHPGDDLCLRIWPR